MVDLQRRYDKSPLVLQLLQQPRYCFLGKGMFQKHCKLRLVSKEPFIQVTIGFKLDISRISIQQSCLDHKQLLYTT